MTDPTIPPHPADTIAPAPARDTGSLGAAAVAGPAGNLATQAASIEAVRAVAEVQALVGAARMFPRVTDESIRRMREACSTQEIADDAFWAFRRGGQQLTGPTVQLMVQLALAWGNITHGHDELRRGVGESEMQAFAWDLEANVRVTQKFVVPHYRDKDGGRVPLTQDRDIYENNSNMASRRMREAIRKVLPPWFVAEAIELCRATLTGDPSVPIAVRVAKAVGMFGDDYGVRPDQLETWLGADRNSWTVYDLGRLSALKSSLHRGETTVAAEFAPPAVTKAEIAAQSAAAANPPEVGTYAPDDPERPFT